MGWDDVDLAASVSDGVTLHGKTDLGVGGLEMEEVGRRRTDIYGWNGGMDVDVYTQTVHGWLVRRRGG